MNSGKPKEIFVHNRLIHKNLSHFCNNCYLLRDSKSSLWPIFQGFNYLIISCFSHNFPACILINWRIIFKNQERFLFITDSFKNILSFFVSVDYCTLPYQDWISRHSYLRTDVAIYVISEQSWVPSVILVLSHWTDGVSDGFLWLSILYCVMVIIALILILVTCINLWYHDLAVIFIWTWLYIVLCIDVPT